MARKEVKEKKAVKDTYIMIRIDAAEKKELKEYAAALGLSLGSYCVMLHRQNIKKRK